jgi:hypothetical protein
MMYGNGMGFNWEGLYTTSLLDAHANWRARANELSRTLKISMLVGTYFIKHYRGHFYAKAQNLARLLRKAYDDTLSRYDLLEGMCGAIDRGLVVVASDQHHADRQPVAHAAGHAHRRMPAHVEGAGVAQHLEGGGHRVGRDVDRV